MITQLLRRIVLVALVAAIAAGCTDSAPVDPGNPGSSQNDASTVELATLYSTLPDPSRCIPGALLAAERTKVLNYLNALRAIHNLAPVEYRAGDDPLTERGAVIIAANRVLTHAPEPSLLCYTEQGKEGLAKSNIALSTFSSGTLVRASESWIDLWIKDRDVPSLGHRRWLLDPFLKHVSFSRVDVAPAGGTFGVSAAVIKVINDDLQNLSGSSLEFVATPFHDYPASAFDDGLELSFSVLADRNNRFANSQVDFSTTTVAMFDAAGSPVAVGNVSSSNDFSGLPNLLKWTAPLQRGVRYTVKVRDVKFNGQSRDYEYWFTLGPVI